MWPFSRKAKSEPKVGYTGQPVFVNLSPDDRRAVLRHLVRIRTCRQACRKASATPERIASLQAEVRRRVNLLAAAGIETPTNDAGLVGLIEEYGG